MRVLLNFLLVISIVTLSSCSTIHKSIKHGKLEVETKMSDTIFLDPAAKDKKTVILQIMNTTDRQDFHIKNELCDALESKGYRVVNDPKEAHFMIQANILQIGKSNLDDPFDSMSGGYGAGVQGAVLGGAMGGSIGGGRGAFIGGLVVGLGSTIMDAMVELIQFSMITDLQISEKAEGMIVDESSKAKLKQGTSGNKKSSWTEKTNWKKYQTRVMSVAKKTNLKFDAALPHLKSGLVQSISGIFE